TGGTALKSVTAGGGININNYNGGALTIATALADNSGTPLNVGGTGPTILTRASTYTGAAHIHTRALHSSRGGTIGATSAVTVDAGGALVVDGGASSVTTTGALTVGNNSAGAFTVRNGGSVSSGSGVIGAAAGSSGTATVTGTGSQWTNGTALTV